jgi:hypothetical protein
MRKFLSFVSILILFSLPRRQRNDEIHSLARAVVDFDLAAMGGDNSVDNRQPQAQTGFLCGIEGVKILWRFPGSIPFPVSSTSALIKEEPFFEMGRRRRESVPCPFMA